MYQKRFWTEDDVAVVTGGGRGIGLCSAEALAESGARVVIVERDETVGRAGLEAARRRP
jgi:NAD(P)-dependent dehydrogenase (short-subunit alcohol dehydrogenase family)